MARPISARSAVRKLATGVAIVALGVVLTAVAVMLARPDRV